MKRHDLNKHNHSIGGNGVKQKDSLSIPTWVYTENSSDRGPGFFVTLKAHLGSHGYAKTESGFVVGPAITAVISAKDAKSFESDRNFCSCLLIITPLIWSRWTKKTILICWTISVN